MSLAEHAVAELKSAEEYFNRSTRGLAEEHSGLMPAPGMMTAAQQVAHAAQTIEWLIAGAFDPKGFDLDFDAHAKVAQACTSLAVARAWFEKAIVEATATIGSKGDAELMTPLPDGPVMGGAPRMAIFGAITDHTAHHRGALTVYARTKGIVPPMPYGDM